MPHFLNFIVLAAVVLRLFGNFAAPVKFGRLDVALLFLEYGQPNNVAYRTDFVDCLNHTFNFGPNDTDCRSTVLCSSQAYFDGFYSTWYQMLRGELQASQKLIECFEQGNNSINRPLIKLKEAMIAQRTLRMNRSVVTIVFGDENLNNDLWHRYATFYVNPPNQMYFSIQNLPADTSKLAKNGIAPSHLLKFEQGKCPDFVNEFQRLICSRRGDNPTEGACKPINTANECEKELTYQPPLRQAETICGNLLEPLIESVNCTCNTTTTTVQETTKEIVTTTTNKGLSVANIVGIVIGVIIVILIFVTIAIGIWFFVRGKSGTSSEPADAEGGSQAEGGGTLRSPSQRVGGGASQKSTSKPTKSVSKPQQKTAKSVVRGGQSKTGGSKMVKPRMRKK